MGSQRDSRPKDAGKEGEGDKNGGDSWKGFSFPPLQGNEASDVKAVDSRKDRAAEDQPERKEEGVAEGKQDDLEVWKGFSFPKFESSGEKSEYDIIEVLQASSKQASESFPFPFGDGGSDKKKDDTADIQGAATKASSADDAKDAATAKDRAGQTSQEEPEQMQVLRSQIDKARMDLADAAMRLSNFEQEIAGFRKGIGNAGNGTTSKNPTVTLTREGTDTIIRIDEAALGEGKTRKKVLSILNSALAGIRFPASASSAPSDAKAGKEKSAEKDAKKSRAEATGPKRDQKAKEEQAKASGRLGSARRGEFERAKRESWEAKEEDALLKDIMRQAKIPLDAALEADQEGRERRRIARTRTLTGVAKVVRAWYGNPRDIMNLYNETTKMLDEAQARDAASEGQPDFSFWEALWKTESDSLLGKDVTDSVAACLKVDPEEKQDSAVAVGRLELRDSLNDILGDPAFGVNKVLVVEFLDAAGNNMTAAWMESASKPRIWTNELPQTVVSEIAGGVLESLQKRREAGDQLLDLDSGGNSWIKKMLWLPDDQLRDEVWVEDEAEKEATKETQAGKPPPAVIPFIKYASPGPPENPWTEPDCNLPEFRILSLDGGGVRGVLSAVILSRIVEAVPSFLDNVDLIAGTSTGGLISLMLAAGYTPRECQAIYEYGCPLIFAKDPWRVYNPLKAKFSAKGREDLCRTYLGEDRTLRDLQKHVVVTAFKLDGKVGPMGTFISNNGGWRPSVFSNIPKMDGVIEPELDMYCWDAALRTSAAPTYFPAHRGYVDGAMFANNPSMLAVTKACAHFPRVSPDNMVVLSLGAGNFPISIDTANQDMDWGIKDWVPFIFDLMMDGDSLSGELLLRYMLNSPQGDFTPEHRYHRIDPTLESYVELDDVDVIPDLIRLAEEVDLTDAIAFAQRHFSNTPSASDAFAQAAQRTATWAKAQATGVELRKVIESLAVMPSNGISGTWPGWPQTDEAAVLDPEASESKGNVGTKTREESDGGEEKSH